MKFMKKVKLLLPYSLCVALAMFLFSCAKDGVDGKDGINGTNGTNGAPGAQGPPGTANVIYSAWIDTINFKPDTVMTGAVIDTVGYFANLNVPKLDLTILNTGEIKVYFNLGDATNPAVFPLPYNDGSIFIDPVYLLNRIQLYSNAELDGLPVRYVLIPGGTTARSAKSINWNNYAEVQKYLGLTD